jgi:uncharacterized protein
MKSDRQVDNTQGRWRLIPFFVWLAIFYAAWVAVVSLGELWPVVFDHWPIALVMLLGSYVAGSTPMGGGTVGFPVLVLVFDQDPSMGRDFSFAVQAVGMTSAAIFIFCRRLPVETTTLGWAMIGSTLGTPLGILLFAPLVPGLAVKLLFSIVWASFGIMTLYKLREISAAEGIARASKRFDRLSGLTVGLVGGTFVASVTGVGVDMLIYTVLVLVRRADLRVAIPTSVIMMAYTSVVGVAVKSLATGFSPGVFENWLAAAPVVALGAPLGAYVVHLVGRQRTLVFVALLCLLQFFWTYQQSWDDLGVPGLMLGLVGLLIFNGIFHYLYRLGKILAADGRPVERLHLLDFFGQNGGKTG